MATRGSARLRSRLSLLGGALIACLGVTAGTVAAAPGTGPAPLVVTTDKGAIQGMTLNNAREFLGVPYAAPPVGALRWRPPQPAAPWSGVRDATKPGPNCAQTGNIATGVPFTSTDEDCLYLNVYTPTSAPARPLPVMVWIHGGGFVGGAGSIYDGAALASKGDTMVVTINYRLGAFGFLALPSLDNESADRSSGAYGLMDQQAALRWAVRNAVAFGGNPRDVTIFGESAGGASVCANMASPTAFGLFQRAIAESGCLLPTPTKTTAEQHGATFATAAGCTDPATAAACLRGKSASDVLAADAASGGGSLVWAPVTGGRTLPLAPQTAFTIGAYAHVPLLQGSNHDEGEFFVALQFDALGHPITAAQYPALIQARFGSAAPQVLAHYPLANFPSPDLAFARVLTDSSFSCPALLADTLTAGSGSFGYEFADPSPPNDFGLTFSFPLGAAHSTELQYVFQSIPFLDVTPPFTPAQFALSDQMIGYWTRFAANGDPNGPGAPHWPRFLPLLNLIQELVPSATVPEHSFATEHQCGFWAQILLTNPSM